MPLSVFPFERVNDNLGFVGSSSRAYLITNCLSDCQSIFGMNILVHGKLFQSWLSHIPLNVCLSVFFGILHWCMVSSTSRAYLIPHFLSVLLSVGTSREWLQHPTYHVRRPRVHLNEFDTEVYRSTANILRYSRWKLENSPNYEWFAWHASREHLPFRTSCPVLFWNLLMLQLFKFFPELAASFLDFSLEYPSVLVKLDSNGNNILRFVTVC